MLVQESSRLPAPVLLFQPGALGFPTCLLLLPQHLHLQWERGILCLQMCTHCLPCLWATSAQAVLQTGVPSPREERRQRNGAVLCSSSSPSPQLQASDLICLQSRSSFQC